MYQLGFAHSCATSCLSFYVSARLHSLLHCILPLFACITSHEAWSLPDLSFSLTCIKTGIQLYVQKIRADGYKTPCWPIRWLFSLVYIAWMHIFINLYFSQLWARRSLSKSDLIPNAQILHGYRLSLTIASLSDLCLFRPQPFWHSFYLDNKPDTSAPSPPHTSLRRFASQAKQRKTLDSWRFSGVAAGAGHH